MYHHCAENFVCGYSATPSPFHLRSISVPSCEASLFSLVGDYVAVDYVTVGIPQFEITTYI